MGDSPLVRQRVGIEPTREGWQVVVKVGAGSVLYEAYRCPGLAQIGAEALAARLGAMWARLGIRIDIRVWVHEVLRVAA